MSPQALHSVTTDRTRSGNVSVRDLASAANFAFAQQDGSSSDQGILSPKSSLSFDCSDSCEESHFKKRKLSVSTMVDDIFAGTDESFFLQNRRSKMRRCMSRTKSYRSLVPASLSDTSASCSSESMASKSQSDSIEKDNSAAGHVSAINIYHKLFQLDLQTPSSSFSSKGSTKDNQGSFSSDRSRSNSFSFLQSGGSNEGTYGWFVQTDDDHKHDLSRRASTTNVAFEDLAFKAPTAPKRVDDNAEVEWARAADTVDDVLRDLF